MKVNKNIDYKYSLNEIMTGQMVNTILDDQGNIISRLFQCKDYMQDIYWAEKLNVNISQYGLEYDGAKLNNVLNKKIIKLLVTSKNNDVDYTLVIENIIKALNIVEDRFTFINSTFELSDDDKKDVIILFSEEWFNKPYLISLFMLLVKTCHNFKGNNVESLILYLQSDDKSINMNYLNQLKFLNKHNIFTDLFINLNFHDCKWEDYKSSECIHSNAGLMSFYSILMENDDLVNLNIDDDDDVDDEDNNTL